MEKKIVSILICLLVKNKEKIERLLNKVAGRIDEARLEFRVCSAEEKINSCISSGKRKYDILIIDSMINMDNLGPLLENKHVIILFDEGIEKIEKHPFPDYPESNLYIAVHSSSFLLILLKRIIRVINQQNDFYELFVKSKEFNKLNTIIRELYNAAFTEGDIRNFYERIHQSINEFIESPNFYIALKSDHNTLQLVYHEDQFDSNPIELPWNKRGITEYLISSGEIINITPQNYEYYLKKINFIHRGVPPVNWLGFPLKSKTETFGAMVIQNYEKELKYTEEIRNILGFIANQIAFEIEMKISFENLKMQSAIVDNVSDSILILDGNHNIIWANPSFLDIYRAEANEIVGRKITCLICEKTKTEIYKEIKQSIFSGKSWEGEVWLKNTAGDYFYIECTISSVTDDQHNIYRSIIIGRDISHKQNLQIEIMQSKKLEGFSIIAGGVAHDFNNVLGAINGLANLYLKTGETANNKDLDYIKEIAKISRQAKDLSKQLLLFSRKQELDNEIISVNTEIMEFSKVWSSLLGNSIELSFDLDKTDTKVHLHPSKFSQIILNLIVNAKDAISHDKGKIIIKTKANARIPDLSSFPVIFPKNTQFQDKAGFITIHIIDNGSGIPENIYSRILDPYFTTKKESKGTGLGLAVICNIIEQNQGILGFKSEPGKGTEFMILLPGI